MKDKTNQHLSIYDGLLTIEGNGVKTQVIAWQEEDMESPYLANLEAADPEAYNYAKEYPELVEKLTKLYHDWAATVVP